MADIDVAYEPSESTIVVYNYDDEDSLTHYGCYKYVMSDLDPPSGRTLCGMAWSNQDHWCPDDLSCGCKACVDCEAAWELTHDCPDGPGGRCDCDG